MAEAADEQRRAQIQCLLFTLEEETYGINVMQVREVLRAIEVTPVPGAPPDVMGIINLQGKIVSVMDMRVCLGLPNRSSIEQSQIIIIELAQHLSGILVDSVTEVIDIDCAAIAAAPNTGTKATTRYIDGIVSQKGKSLILVALQKCFSAKTWSGVESF